MKNDSDNPKNEEPGGETSAKSGDVRCLSRRVWDWGRKWGQTLIHLVWFWRAAVLILVVVAGVFAWHEPDVQQRLAATGLVLVLGIVLALDLFVAFLNLPLLMFYTLLWTLLTLTSILDVLFYARHLAAKQNRIAVTIILANIALVAGCYGLWLLYQSLGHQDEPIQPGTVDHLTSLLG